VRRLARGRTKTLTVRVVLLLLAIPALFVGNQACSRCHAEIAGSYGTTPMSISSGRVSNVANGSFRHAPSGVQYEIDGRGWSGSRKAPHTASGSWSITWGPAPRGRSFLFRNGSFLFEAPVTWYTRNNAWDVSPGYESDRVSRWNRAVEPSCLQLPCKPTAVAAGDANAYRDPPFEENGVSCERCHGPGSLHIEGKGAMVNPAKLAPAAAIRSVRSAIFQAMRV